MSSINDGEAGVVPHPTLVGWSAKRGLSLKLLRGRRYFSVEGLWEGDYPYPSCTGTPSRFR